ncbi:MAG: WYL domain-containing protein [Deltaproteobacteria bacterium]|nr:WYL domain-containing protein [Deltaproteobacteria bacterium]
MKPRKPASRRGSSIERAFRLVRHLLGGHSLDRHSAAEILGVDHPAASKHLRRAAEILDLEVEEGPTRGRVYRMREQRAGRVRDNEVVAFALGAALAPIFRGSAHEAGMRAARDAVVRGAAPARTNLNRKFGFVPRGGELALPDRAGELDEIVDALLREEALTVRYQHFDGTVDEMLLLPLSLLVHEHQLYLVAYTATPADARPYRFSRLTAVDRTGPRFSYPSVAAYNPEEFFRLAFGIFLNQPGRVEQVIVQLTKRWKVHAETHRWHATQRVIQANAGPRIELTVRVCPELIAWVRSFGPEARVVAPASLRRAVEA